MRPDNEAHRRTSRYAFSSTNRRTARTSAEAPSDCQRSMRSAFVPWWVPRLESHQLWQSQNLLGRYDRLGIDCFVGSEGLAPSLVGLRGRCAALTLRARSRGTHESRTRTCGLKRPLLYLRANVPPSTASTSALFSSWFCSFVVPDGFDPLPL